MDFTYHYMYRLKGQPHQDVIEASNWEHAKVTIEAILNPTKRAYKIDWWVMFKVTTPNNETIWRLE